MDTIPCPLNPGHQHAGPRRSDLKVVVTGAGGDIIWTWQSDCLFSDNLIDLIRSEGLSGLAFRPATVLSNTGKPLAQSYREAIVTGWAGVASTESGIHLRESCPGCGLLTYSCFTDPSKLIDKQWDGSDFFIVWPMPRYILISQKVANLFKRRNIGPCRFIPISELRCGESGFGPGRLSYWMPPERAKVLGQTLGIE